jgi:3-phosphoglycerate kinase
LSFKPVNERIVKLGMPCTFIEDYKIAHSYIEEKMKNGDVVLLENLRFYEGEKNNDMAFARQLASFGDMYVNEAFPSSHREHASIFSVPKLIPSYAGLQLEKEVEHLSRTFNPPRPFVFILNGAKFETKLPLLKKFLEIADTVFVGGALANDFFKQKGYELGTSLVSAGNIDLSQYASNTKLLLPIDVMDEKKQIWLPEGFPKDGKIVDAGPKTMAMLKEKIAGARFVLWNGTIGLYELGYNKGTEDLAKCIAENTKRGLMSVVGGGDTVAALEDMKLTQDFTFVSSGGGAMLDFLAKGTLPGIQALNGDNL